MRNIAVSEIGKYVETLLVEACCELPKRVEEALIKALNTERGEHAQDVLEQIIENAHLAWEMKRPICQDTGMAVVFLEVGQDVHFTGGDLTAAVNDGVRRAYTQNYLRRSVLDPLTRQNTHDNAPAVLHVSIEPGARVRIRVAPKGFGCENTSALKMLPPSAGIEGIKDFVVETVKNAGSNACPPLVIGVGIGGTMEKAAILAKRELLRPLTRPAESEQTEKLERELLERINALGIGPMGLGGDTTALAVLVATHPTHIAGLPVAVNIQCHAARHKEWTL